MTREGPLTPHPSTPHEPLRPTEPAPVDAKRQAMVGVDSAIRALLPPEVRWMVGAYGE